MTYDSPADLICGLVSEISTVTTMSRTGKDLDLPDRLGKLALRGPYRRSACSPVSLNDVHRKITEAILGGQPIRFSVPFGGYKLWRLESSPWPDWGEVFAVLYLLEYITPIAVAYEPGVEVIFSYCSLGVAEANGLEAHSIPSYVSRFSDLLFECQRLHGQTNARLQLFDVATLYDGDEGMQELEKKLAETRSRWSLSIPQEDRERMIASARRNLRISANHFSETELQKKYEESAQAVYAVDSLSKRRWFNKYSDKIQLVYVRGPEPSIHIGSCRTSICQFNVGSGVVDVSSRGYAPRIASADSLSRSHSLGVVDVQRCWPSLCRLDPRFRLIGLYKFSA